MAGVRSRWRLTIGCVATLAIVLPLGWMWWSSRLPASYDVTQMGYADYGGGPHGSHGHHGAGTLSVADLDTDPGRKADVVVDLTARAQTFALASGRRFDGFTLNGQSPGPQIRARVGQLVEVHLHNASVAEGITLHWHGVDVPNAEDGVAGVTQNAVQEGESYTYRWVAPHVGTYWYHSHQISHEQVAGGLFGSIVVLPRGGEDPDLLDVTAVAHLYGGTHTVNGLEGDQPVVAEPGQRVRIRVVNTDNGPIEVWSGAAYTLVAHDGYAVHGPGPVTDRSVDVPAGGRADLELTAPTDGSAVRVQIGGGAALVVGPPGATAPAVAQPRDQLDLLSYGTPLPAGASIGFDPTAPDRSFDYEISREPGFIDGRPGVWWAVNGHLFPDLPMFMVRQGDVVRMHLDNHSGDVHPMHLHGHHAVVVARDGHPVTGSPWWFDSLDVRDGETFDVAFVADNPGIWMDHCHNLKHAAQGLVTHLMYEGVSEPYRVGGDSGNEPE